MHATIRRYEKVDVFRTDEIIGGVGETLIPELRELEGFAGYYLIRGGKGILSSLSLFETAEQADESTKLAAMWIADENFGKAIRKPPKITSGEVVAYSSRQVLLV
ncbi:MAG TPA: hypothetical protein VIU44_12735 [Gaiellaceae bacterium]